MYQYALILYHLTTARGLGSGARSVSENAKVNSRAVVVASPPVARWWPVGVPARRHEAVTRHGRGFQLCWCWLAWHADLAPDRAEWATTRRAPAGRCAWAVRGVLVRAWLRDASLMVRAHVLCSTSRATCTDPPATPPHRDYHARRPDLRHARHRWRARPRPRPRLHPPWPPRPMHHVFNSDWLSENFLLIPD